MQVRTYKEEFGGKPLLIEIGKLAQQANGSVRVQYGETTVLVTAVMGPQKNVDYFPLSVDFEEKYYAAGKIKGSKWIKREGRPSEEAILSGRLIDRTLRPRFDHQARNEVQIVATVLSFDKINDADIPAMFGASLALMISDIPFNGPVAGVRVGRVGGKLIINPTYLERIDSDFDIVCAGTGSRINMIEAGAKIVAEKDIAEAMEYGFKEYQKLIAIQEKIAADIAPTKRELALAKHDEELAAKVREFAIPRLNEALYVKDKKVYYENLARVKSDLETHIKETYTESPDLAKKLAETEHLFEDAVNVVVHKNILESGKRPDGRKTDELRELSAEVSVLPHSHGTGLFQRGQTQALSSLTLAAPGMEQWIETMEIDLTKKRFMHHYVFPPFSVGETGRLGMPGRREIGHGALAEKALLPIIPAKEEFPYTIRVVSEILGSNGSSSMASVCGATLAMMDGGVPLKMPAAGIAMGIMFDDKGEQYKILTDIQGAEDHHGDMDLKVAGTKDGVTAMQMDVKIDGITPQIVAETLEQARKARLEILTIMEKAIATHRAELSSYAPRVQTIKINPDKIGAVIGSGGKTINAIIEETGAEIDIEDDGSIFITCATAEGMDKAIQRIKDLTYEPRPGEVFTGTVVKLLDFGAFVEFMPGMDGMVHVSEISKERRIDRPADVLKVGQKVRVMIKNVDDQGRINLTIKNAPQE